MKLFKYFLITVSFLYSIPAAPMDTDGLDKWNVTKWSLTDTKLMEVRSVYMDYMHYAYAVEPFLLPNTPVSRLDLHLDLEFLNRTFFLDNMVHSETDQYNYALVGWNYRLGAHLSSYIDVFFEHYSQHLLDTTSIVGPNVYDAVGFRLYFYKRDK